MNRLDDLYVKLFIWQYNLYQAELLRGYVSRKPKVKECLSMIEHLQKEIDYHEGASGNEQLGHTKN